MASSLFQIKEDVADSKKPGNGENATAISTGGIATGDQDVFLINKTNSALNFPEITSSSAALTHDGVFPRTLQSGESYRFLATATGPAHSLSYAIGEITSKHTYNSVDAANAHGDNDQRVYIEQID